MDTARKVAIMQPYIFPYIGYFQLINAVEDFVFLDTVNFIKQGWISRNRILDTKGEPQYFTIPIKNMSSFMLIKDTKVNPHLYLNWQKKFYKSLYQYYNKAPYYKEVTNLVNQVFENQFESISEYAIMSVKEICKYLEIETNLHIASSNFLNVCNDRKERIFEICHSLKANQYINSYGGIELYNTSDFSKRHLDLRFIKSKEIEYEQFNFNFQPWLSIIDLLMFNNKTQIQGFLNQYELTQN